MAYFTVFNGAMATTAAQLAVATGTNIITLLQVKPKAAGRIVDWGISFSGAAVAAGIEAELLSTAAVFATVTASVEADCYKVDGSGLLAASYLTLSTSGTGFTSSNEGSITATTIYDSVYITPTNWYRREFERRYPPLVDGVSYRIRVKAASGVNAKCWMTLEF